MSGDLAQQIDSKRKEIQTDSYSMSVGELVNLYKDGDLEIYPEFQRYFRWSPAQKSRFIESLLLGIPIPSIFVHQRPDGVWDVIDGLQRLSTILEFMGELKTGDEANEPSVLLGTEYLPALEGCYWDEAFGTPSLNVEQRRIVKRSPIDIKIVKRESDEDSKYDLFDRLNTGGSALSDQELRNALLLMHNPEYARFVDQLAHDENFVESTILTEKNLQSSYDRELVLRFVLFSEATNEDLRAIGDLSDYLTKASVKQAAAFSSEKREEICNRFTQTFAVINEALGEDAFKKWNPEKSRFQGGFTVSGYEAVAIGVAENLEYWLSADPHELKCRVQQLWEREKFASNSGQGVRANTRVSRVLPFAKEFFSA